MGWIIGMWVVSAFLLWFMFFQQLRWERRRDEIERRSEETIEQSMARHPSGSARGPEDNADWLQWAWKGK